LYIPVRRGTTESLNILGPLAQQAEHLTFNQGVPRSSRGWLTSFKRLRFKSKPILNQL
ncbi:MAG: hypothetical protein PWP07_2230, partial [Epulopiscium sp.]|nr:hypothetical protein [Candidatus Epulonipiscium sp.]